MNTRESSDRRLLRVSEALSDDRAIDWDEEGADRPRLRRRLRRLQQLEALARAHRGDPPAPDATPHTDAPARGFAPCPFDWGTLRVLEPIGQGSFGEVYRAFEPRLEREVALKLRRIGFTESDASAKRFLDEARHLARVRHPHVVVVYGADIHDRRLGFWTDLIRGQTLAARLEESGTFGAEEATLVGQALCAALAAVHGAGLVHGDVKAANVMREDGGRILLMDFGAVSRLGRPEQTDREEGRRFGTPLVLAPEVLRGAPPQPSSDLYSLGVLLYQLVTGRTPIEAATWEELLARHDRREARPLRDLRPDLPASFVRAVERALEPDARERFRSAGEMERSLLASVLPSVEIREEGQSLRSLLDELGRLSEEMCRQIGREAARALAGLHASGAAMGPFGLEQMMLRSDGALELSGDRPSDARDAGEDLRRLGRILFELVTGRPPPAAEGARQEPTVSPFLGAVLHALVDRDCEAPIPTARDLHLVLSEGERSAWWRERRRALRRSRTRSPRRMVIPRGTAVHGRDAELASLAALFEQANHGEGRVVLIEGEAGIGKTRLVDQLVSDLAREGEDFQFLFGSYPPGGAATAAGAFLNAYREHFGEEMLDVAIEDHLARAPLLIPSFRALMQGEGGGPDASVLTKDALHTAFVHVTRALAAERPTIILIDDLHFAPDEGRALFTALALAAPGHPILLIGGARPELPENWVAGIQRQPHCSRLVLSRLTERGVSDILAEAYGSRPLAEQLAPEMAGRCDGNPLFLLETLRVLEETHHLTRNAAGDWVVSGSPRQMPVPPSIRQLIQARLAALSERDRELLDVASCCGFEFDPALVGESLGLGALPILKRCARIEKRHGLIHAAGRRYVFDHHLVQEALHDALFEPLRERYHVTLARALEARERDTRTEPLGSKGAIKVAICEHYLRGGLGSEGLPYLAAALDHLESTYSNAAAVELARRALDFPGLLAGGERIRLLVRTAGRLGLIARHEEAESALKESLALAEEARDQVLSAFAKAKLGNLLYQRGRLDEATAILREAVTEARAAGDPETEGLARSGTGSVLFFAGRFDEARVEFEEAISIARRSEDLEGEGRALTNLGVVLNALGRHGEAEWHLRVREAQAREMGDRAGEANASGNLGMALNGLGRFDEARACFERLLLLSRQAGYRLGEHHAYANLGGVLQQLGLYGEALECLEAQLRLIDELGHPQGKPVCLGNMSMLLATLGDFGRAREGLVTARALCDEGGFRWVAGNLLQCSGDVEQDAGDLEAAERYYRDALAAHRTSGDQRGIAMSLESLGAAEAARGRFDEARGRLEEARRVATECGSDREIGSTSIRLALLPGGSVDAAREAFEELGPRLSHCDRMRMSHRLWRATGDRTHIEEARRLLLVLRDHAPVRYRESLLERVPLHREILSDWGAQEA